VACFYENGTKQIEGAYNQDLKEGMWIEFDEGGNKTNQYIFKAGNVVK